MATNEQITALQNEISELETLVNAGVTSVTQDGQTTAFDQTATRKRLRELQAELAKCQTAAGRCGGKYESTQASENGPQIGV